MSETSVAPDDALSVEAALRLDAVCERFESAWLAGRRPTLERFLDGAGGDERVSLLHELLQLELDYRRRLGETPPPAEYEERFPDDVPLVRAAFAAHLAHSTLPTPHRRPPVGDTTTEPQGREPLTVTAAGRTEPEKRSWRGRWRDGRFPHVPGYEVLEELGHGGMGVVFKARQTALKRLVALKMILSGDYAAAEEIARFKTEAEAIARLQHQNIVQIYEVGEHDGLPYFAMEYVEGGSLAARLRESLPEPREAAGLIETLARAVHAMHECRVVHRDLKPANVLLQIADGRLQIENKSAICNLQSAIPKITDFGLAKKLDEDSGQTRPGVVMGTPSYMAPEQAEGRGADVGPRTDVYALGAVLYECLTGRPPFRAATRDETLRQVIDQDAIAPRQLNPAVPRDLETIVLKCLQKEPSRRFAGALDLADDLRNYLDGRSIRARPVGPSERAIKWARSRPTQAALALAVAAAVFFALIGVSCYALYKGKEADLKGKEADFLQQQVRLRDEIDAQVRGADRAEREGHFDAAFEQLRNAVALLEASPGTADDDFRQQLTDRRDRARRLAEQEKARQQLDTRVKRFEKSRLKIQYYAISFSERELGLARAVVRREAEGALAELGFTPGDTPEQAGKRLEAFRDSFEKPGEADALAAECYEVLLAWAEAEAPPEKSLHLLDMAAAVAAAHHVAVPQAFHLRRARLLAALGRDEEAGAERAAGDRVAPTTPLDLFLAALDAYRHGQPAMAACDRVLRKDPRHFWARYLLALSHLRAEEWLEAKEGLTACLGERPDFFWPTLFRATAEGGLGNYDAAEADFQAVTRLIGDDPLGLWLLHRNRGTLRAQARRWDGAIADLNEAIRLRPDAVEAYLTLAQAHAGRENYAVAVKVLTEALARRPGDAELYHTRAQMHLKCGDAKAARADFEQAIAHQRHFESVARLAAAVLVPAAPKSARDPRSRAALRLANDYVQLAHLRHESKDYVGALVSCAAALLVWPDYPPAHYQRAETLHALKNYPAAGAALDRYLRRAVPTADVYQARGLIHSELHEYQKAVEAYDRAAQLRPDARTLAYCGWAYLKLDALRPALAKFEAALKLDATNADALCGRGLVRAIFGDARGAVTDAEAVHRHHANEPEWLLQAACVYAQAAQRAATAEAATAYGDRAVALLDEVMNQLPRAQRPGFWHARVEPEKALSPVRRWRGFLEMQQTYVRE